MGRLTTRPTLRYGRRAWEVFEDGKFVGWAHGQTRRSAIAGFTEDYARSRAACRGWAASIWGADFTPAKEAANASQ